MYPKLIVAVLSAAFFQTAVFGGQTEIEVFQGKVRGQTPDAELEISAGQKGLVKEGQEPLVAVNDPLAQEAIQMYRWVEAKRAAGNPVEGATIWVTAVDEEQVCRFALIVEYTYSGQEATSVVQLGPTSALRDLRIYDFEGHLLEYETQINSELTETYLIHFPNPIEPGQNVRFITVSPSYKRFFWLSRGPVWSFSATTGGRLVISKIILPQSAIVLGTYPAVFVTDQVEDRIALTFYDPAKESSQRVHISFLWPDKDGTTLQDIPPEMRGLQDPQQAALIRQYEEGLAKILGGERFSDVSTPMNSLLTCVSLMVHDADRLELIAATVPFIQKVFGADLLRAKSIMDQNKEGLYYADLQTCSPIPPEPKEGNLVSFTFKYKGTFVPIATVDFMYTGGQWLPQIQNALTPPDLSGKVTVTPDRPDPAKATYKNPKPGEFFKQWLFLGPIRIPWAGEGYFPDEQTNKQFFDTDLLNPAAFEPTIRIGEKDYTWSLLESEKDLINLTNAFDQWYVCAYAWAQVEMDQETQARLGIGSDDGVKVWLNGRLVHENWTTRGVEADNDIVPVTFRKGTNQLVIRVQNGGGPWGFACRLLDNQ